MDELTKFCKPLHQAECVTSRTYCFVLLPPRGILSLSCASNILRKQQLLCQYRRKDQASVTFEHSAEPREISCEERGLSEQTRSERSVAQQHSRTLRLTGENRSLTLREKSAVVSAQHNQL